MALNILSDLACRTPPLISYDGLLIIVYLGMALPLCMLRSLQAPLHKKIWLACIFALAFIFVALDVLRVNSIVANTVSVIYIILQSRFVKTQRRNSHSLDRKMEHVPLAGSDTSTLSLVAWSNTTLTEPARAVTPSHSKMRSSADPTTPDSAAALDDLLNYGVHHFRETRTLSTEV